MLQGYLAVRGDREEDVVEGLGPVFMRLPPREPCAGPQVDEGLQGITERVLGRGHGGHFMYVYVNLLPSPFTRVLRAFLEVSFP